MQDDKLKWSKRDIVLLVGIVLGLAATIAQHFGVDLLGNIDRANDQVERAADNIDRITDTLGVTDATD